MKIALFGDSITQGIGSRKVSYADVLSQHLLGVEINNYALTGTTIKYGTSKLNELVFSPDVVIVAYGNVDAMPRPDERCFLYKILPNRYKGLGMLDPRALYTSKPLKGLLQKLDSSTRYRIKKYIIKNKGYTQWVGPLDFENSYRSFLKVCKERNYKVLLVSTVPMYEKYFPHANKEYTKYNEIIRKLSIEYNFEYVDIYNEMLKYDRKHVFLSDYFHPNEIGYKVIGEKICEKIMSLRIGKNGC